MPETATSDTSAETAGDEGEETSTDQTSQNSEESGTDAWKARAREWEKRAKANADAAKKLAEIEDAQKTEQQKLAEKLAAAESAKAEAELTLLRAQVASDKGLSPSLAARLQGDNLKEIQRDADALLSDMRSIVSKPDLKQGDRGADASGTDVDAWIRKQAGR